MAANRRLQQRPGEGTEFEAELAAGRPPRTIQDAKIASLIQQMAAGFQEVGGDPRQKLLDDHQSPLE
jgi:hypothetical protein